MLLLPKWGWSWKMRKTDDMLKILTCLIHAITLDRNVVPERFEKGQAICPAFPQLWDTG